MTTARTNETNLYSRRNFLKMAAAVFAGAALASATGCSSSQGGTTNVNSEQGASNASTSSSNALSAADGSESHPYTSWSDATANFAGSDSGYCYIHLNSFADLCDQGGFNWATLMQDTSKQVEGKVGKAYITFDDTNLFGILDLQDRTNSEGGHFNMAMNGDLKMKGEVVSLYSLKSFQDTSTLHTLVDKLAAAAGLSNPMGYLDRKAASSKPTYCASYLYGKCTIDGKDAIWTSRYIMPGSSDNQYFTAEIGFRYLSEMEHVDLHTDTGYSSYDAFMSAAKSYAKSKSNYTWTPVA